MNIAILTPAILPVPATQGGAVENLTDFYLDYNAEHRLHDITVYSVADRAAASHPALKASANHYCHIDTDSLRARARRRIFGMLHRGGFYNHFIEYFFEQAWRDIRHRHFDAIVLENRPGYALKLAERTDTPLLLHLHNDLLNATTPQAERLLDSVARIAVVSDFIGRRVRSIKPTDKVTVVYNGIELEHFADGGQPAVSRQALGFAAIGQPAVSRQALGFADGDFVIVYSGRINPDKGISQLLDAMALLSGIPHARLLVLGSPFFANAADDDFVRRLKHKAQALGSRVVFTGFVPYERVPAYLHIADVAVVPSQWDEPFGLTCAEAMAAARPVVTTDRGGIPEVVGTDGALIVPVGDGFARRLAEAIALLHDRPELRRQLAACAQRRAARFSKQRYARQFLNTLNGL